MAMIGYRTCHTDGRATQADDVKARKRADGLEPPKSQKRTGWLEDHAITVRKVEKTARSGKGRVAGRGRRAQEGRDTRHVTAHGASECYPFRPCRTDVCPVCGGVLRTKRFYHVVHLDKYVLSFACAAYASLSHL